MQLLFDFPERCSSTGSSFSHWIAWAELLKSLCEVSLLRDAGGQGESGRDPYFQRRAPPEHELEYRNLMCDVMKCKWTNLFLQSWAPWAPFSERCCMLQHAALGSPGLAARNAAVKFHQAAVSVLKNREVTPCRGHWWFLPVSSGVDPVKG